MTGLRFRGFDDAFAYLRTFTDYERMAGPRYGPKGYNLDRTRALLAAVGDPHLHLSVVHVTGTKGKGSTAMMIAAILRVLGLRVGLFTSPHLVHLRERVQVDGRPIPPGAFAARMNEMAPYLDAVREGPEGSHPTFFEIMTALGFLHFLRRKVDYAVVEVGLGGRLDSTNVVEPRSTVITNVDLDHTDRLGDTIAKIAVEKAGILKARVPAVTAAAHPDALEVIESRARELGVPLRRVGREVEVHDVRATTLEGVPAVAFQVETDRRSWGRLFVRAAGAHQATNAATAIAAIEDLSPAPFRELRRAVVEGLSTLHLPARVELVRTDPDVVVDGAHNPVSMASLRAALADHFPGRPLVLVLGISKDKDVDGVLREIVPAASAIVFTKASHPRAADPEDLLARVRAIAPDIAAWTSPDPRAAVRIARAACVKEKLLVVTGSFFLAGEVVPFLRGPARSRAAAR